MLTPDWWRIAAPAARRSDRDWTEGEPQRNRGNREAQRSVSSASCHCASPSSSCSARSPGLLQLCLCARVVAHHSVHGGVENREGRCDHTDSGDGSGVSGFGWRQRPGSMDHCHPSTRHRRMYADTRTADSTEQTQRRQQQHSPTQRKTEGNERGTEGQTFDGSDSNMSSICSPTILEIRIHTNVSVWIVSRLIHAHGRALFSLLFSSLSAQSHPPR